MRAKLRNQIECAIGFETKKGIVRFLAGFHILGKARIDGAFLVALGDERKTYHSADIDGVRNFRIIIFRYCAGLETAVILQRLRNQNL